MPATPKQWAAWPERANAEGCECETPSPRACAEARRLPQLKCPCPCHQAKP